MTIYSYSRLKCYEYCPQKYKLQYIDKIKIRFKETIELFLGKRVHETLKKLYRDLQYQKENTLDDLLVLLHAQWVKNWNDSIVIVKKEYNQEDYLRMAEQYITNYYNRYRPFNHGRTVALDERILINLNETGNYKLQGYIDRLTVGKVGCYEIHDYKTNSRLPLANNIQNDGQLALYSIGVKDLYPDVKNIRLILHYLKFNKEIVSTRSDDKLAELKNKTIQLIDTIEATTEFPANPSVLCHWCKFKSVCK
jgi:putative RecB family exonuclease